MARYGATLDDIRSTAYLKIRDAAVAEAISQLKSEERNDRSRGKARIKRKKGPDNPVVSPAAAWLRCDEEALAFKKRADSGQSAFDLKSSPST
jgi:hypothetical protein